MVDPRISNITSGGTSVAPKDMSLKYPKGGDGLTIKQRMFEIRTGTIDSMSREEVLKQLKELGLDGKFKKEGNQTVLSVEEKSDSEGIKDVSEMETESSERQKEV